MLTSVTGEHQAIIPSKISIHELMRMRGKRFGEFFSFCSKTRIFLHKNVGAWVLGSESWYALDCAFYCNFIGPWTLAAVHRTRFFKTLAATD